MANERKVEAYKLGDVQSGNWQWAVGIPVPTGLGRYSNLATINTTGAIRTGHDPEELARRIVAALNERS